MPKEIDVLGRHIQLPQAIDTAAAIGRSTARIIFDPKRTGKLLLGEAIWQTNLHMPDYEFDEEANRENVGLINEHLKNGSIILCWGPHEDHWDPGYVLRTIHKSFNRIKDTHILVSQKQLDPNRGFESIFHSVFIIYPSMARGYKVIPVVQKYDEESYPDHVKINKAGGLKAIRVLKSKGGIVMVAPEETRDHGHLLPAEHGAAGLFSLAKQFKCNTAVVTLGISRRGRALSPTINIGRPISYEQTLEEAENIRQIEELWAQDQELPRLLVLDHPEETKEEAQLRRMGDAIMLHIADLIDPSYYGHYANLYFIKQALQR